MDLNNIQENSETVEDTYYDTEYDGIPNTYDSFLSCYTEDILSIFDDLKQRFSINPFFLCKLKGYVFVNFLTNYILNYSDNNVKNYAIKNHIYSFKSQIFEEIFMNELIISYNIISKFIKIFKIELSFCTWKSFCYKYSDIPTI